MSNRQVLEAALRLSEADRLEMAERLWESVGSPSPVMTEAEWAGEIARRVASVRDGTAEIVAGDEARKQIFGK